MTLPEPQDLHSLVEQAAALGISVDESQAREVLAYLDAMLEKNQHINLTAVRERPAALVLHALDSLAFGLADLTPRNVLDLGTGNGFPGVGVAALFPEASVLLMDKTGKKVRAIAECLERAGMQRVEALQMDANQMPALRPEFEHSYDLVTARAVARPAQIAAMAQPLVRPSGYLALWLEEDADMPEKLGRFRRENVVTYELPEPARRVRKLAIWQRS